MKNLLLFFAFGLFFIFGCTSAPSGEPEAPDLLVEITWVESGCDSTEARVGQSLSLKGTPENKFFQTGMIIPIHRAPNPRALWEYGSDNSSFWCSCSAKVVAIVNNDGTVTVTPEIVFDSVHAEEPLSISLDEYSRLGSLIIQHGYSILGNDTQMGWRDPETSDRHAFVLIRKPDHGPVEDAKPKQISVWVNGKDSDVGEFWYYTILPDGRIDFWPPEKAGSLKRALEILLE